MRDSRMTSPIRDEIRFGLPSCQSNCVGARSGIITDCHGHGLDWCTIEWDALKRTYPADVLFSDSISSSDRQDHI